MTNLNKIVVFIFLIIFLYSCTNKINKSNPNLSTYPGWVKDAVFYQIFPERFNNGDTSNDPTIEDQKGSWPHDEVREWSISPWTAAWYKLQPWEELNGKGFYYNAQLRRYGGDIQGIIEKLDYLHELGITAIYLNPVFESPSLHKYDAAYYRHIDDNFGPNPIRDKQIISTEINDDPTTWKWTTADSLFLKFLENAHKKGIHVIIDGVFNHVGLNFWAFRDVREKGKTSKYIDWFTIKEWDDPSTEEDEFDYECWFGAKTLPELKEDDKGIISGPREHIFSIVKRWMDPNGDGDPSDGIDGWRLDVAEKVNPEFWKEFRVFVKKINPNAYITAELFWDDWDEKKLMNPSSWLKGDQFDGVMNYPWGAAVLESFANPSTKLPMSAFEQNIRRLFGNIKDTLNYIQLNLYDSHDTERLSTHLVNPDIFIDTYVSLNNNENYDIRKPNETEIKKQKLLSLIQMTFIGAPMIYYGDEAGMWGADDPDERKPMLWQEFEYENESHHPFGKKRPDDTVVFNTELFEYYKKIINMRNNYAVLRRGNLKIVYTDDVNKTLIYKRKYGSTTCYILLNNSEITQEFELELPGVKKMMGFKNALNPDEVFYIKGNLKMSLPGLSGKVILNM